MLTTTKLTIYPGVTTDLTDTTPVQKEMYNLLKSIGWGDFDLRDLKDRLQLRSILMVEARIRHLRDKHLLIIET